VRVGLGDWFQDHMGKTAENGVRSDKNPAFDTSRFDPSKFMQGFTSEIVQLQMQAIFKDQRPQDQPILAQGLVPSRDGFHWERPVASTRKPVPAHA